MNEKIAKMLRRLQKDSKQGKKKWKSFDWNERSMLRDDYIDRGDEIRKKYSKDKKDKKREQISNS